MGGDVEQGDEHPEEQQGGAQVALEDQHGERDEPRDEQWTEIASPRELEAHELGAHEGQRVTRYGEVAGEEDRQQDLGDLTRLEGQACESHPQPRAVDRRADAGCEWQQQERETHEHRGVGVALQHPVVAHDHEHRDEQQHPEHGPGELGAHVWRRHRGAVARRPLRLGEVEAMDHRQTEEVQGHDDGNDDRIGVGR